MAAQERQHPTRPPGTGRGRVAWALVAVAAGVMLLGVGLFRSCNGNNPPDDPFAGAGDGNDEIGAWEVQNSGVGDDLYAVTFVDHRAAVAVGANSTVLKTPDGGQTWKRAVERRQGGDTFDQVLFSGTLEGWAATSRYGTILHTTDGGDTWQRMTGPDPGAALDCRAVQSAAGPTYFLALQPAAGRGTLSRTDDAGRSWVTVNASLDGGQVVMRDLMHGCLLQTSGQALTTEDGGKTWQQRQKIESAGSAGPRLSFADGAHGWAFCPHRGLHATTDGGKTWKPQDVGAGDAADLLYLHFASATLGHVLTADGVATEVRRTTDGGKSWRPLGDLKAPERVGVHAVCFLSPRQGWVVGDGGFIARYRAR